MKQIVDLAKSYIGQQEIKGNQGFKDKDFEARMEAVGFQKGWAWCCLFAELVWRSVMIDKDEELNKLFSASVTKTANNFKGSDNWKFVKTPKPGALAVWRVVRHGRKKWQGHIGIVEKVNKKDKTFLSIEGNTNSKGGREGIEVARKTRKLEFDKPNGLVLQGFIIPNED